MSYGIITNDINVADSNFRRGTVHFFNAIANSGHWEDVIFEGCYPSLPKLADDEYAIVTAMPFQYYGPQIMWHNSFMMSVSVYKDSTTKQVTLSLRGPRGPNPADNHSIENRIILPALNAGQGGDSFSSFFKGSSIIENGIEKPISRPNKGYGLGYLFVRGYIICMIYKQMV